LNGGMQTKLLPFIAIEVPACHSSLKPSQRNSTAIPR